MEAYSQSECLTLHRFYSRALRNFRSLYIYLPPSYKTDPDRHFPVLYMHDGQNIFSGDESYSGMGWEIHQTADELIECGAMEEIVIIGIANAGEQRLNEYAHSDYKTMGKSIRSKGERYERFLLEDVMPFVEANYRVLTEPENTGLMGSSMGGLVTFMIGTRHPERFGKLGVLSPSFWWNPAAMSSYLDQLDSDHLPKRMWMDMGDSEGHLKEGFDTVLGRLIEMGIAMRTEMAVWVVPGGIHSEYDWQMRAHCPLLYLFGDVGHPVVLELHAPETLVKGDNSHYLRPVLAYDSGFCVTPFEATCWSSAPDVLSLGWDLRLYANAPGKAVLQASCGSLEASRACRVISGQKKGHRR